MVTPIHERPWPEPVIDPRSDAAVERSAKERLGMVPKVVHYTLPVHWLVDAIVTLNQLRPIHLAPRTADLCSFVTAQENACRYCYGSTRAFLRLTGMSERALTTLERDLVLAEAPERDRALLDFCRRLAQSNPRPEKPAYDALRAVGMSDGAIREAAFLVAMTCAANRTGTMLAIPPDVDVERMPDRLLVRAFRPVVGWLARRSGKPAQRSADAPAYTGPYARVLTLLGDSQSALHFGDVLGAMFASSALGRRAILLIFAVVSRALACDHCEGEACANLAADGLAEPEVLRIVTLLDSPALTPTERAVVELARNSVRYHTPAIQEHARKLAATIGRDLTIEAVGVCGIANAVVRLAMLHECA